jgi:hypothetical protein
MTMFRFLEHRYVKRDLDQWSKSNTGMLEITKRKIHGTTYYRVKYYYERNKYHERYFSTKKLGNAKAKADAIRFRDAMYDKYYF